MVLFGPRRGRSTVDVDPRLPVAGELVGCHRLGGPRLLVATVRAVGERALSLQLDPSHYQRVEHEMLIAGEHVTVMGLAGTPIQVEAVVRGYNGSIVVLRDARVFEGRPQRILDRVPVQGRLWCRADSHGGMVEIFDFSLGGVCMAAPSWVRTGEVISLTDPSHRDLHPVWGLVVGRSASRAKRGVVHVAFLAGTPEEAIEALTIGLVPSVDD